MGSTKTTTTSQATPTPEERELERLQLEQYKQIQPQQTQAYGNQYNLINQLLTGQPLSGYFGGLEKGLSPQDIGTQASQYAYQNMPGMQSLGITDSGEALRSISKGIANEILLPAREYNSNLLFNLFNLASGQAAQGTNQFQAGTGLLANQLAGLRKNTQVTKNPFMTGADLMSGIGQGVGIWAATR